MFKISCGCLAYFCYTKSKCIYVNLFIIMNIDVEKTVILSCNSFFKYLLMSTVYFACYDSI